MRNFVSIIRCEDYQDRRVESSVRKACEFSTELDKKIKPGDKVLIKPNLLSPHHPDESITTHPSVIRAVIRLVKDLGGKPLVGDSPGGAYGDLKRLWETTGIAQAAKETGAELVSFEKAGSFIMPLEKGTVLKELNITKIVQDVDFIISVPKFKTHSLTVLTGAVKNTMGFLPGLNKVRIHASAPGLKDFADAILDIWQAIPPSMNIMDAVVALEGDGPSSAGKSRRLGFIVAGEDALAVDMACVRIIGLKPERFPIYKRAVKRGLLQTDVHYRGDDISGAAISGFRLPRMTNLDFLLSFMPKWVARLGLSLIKVSPVIDNSRCSGCRLCMKSCPSESISLGQKGDMKIDLRRCISCLCCFEVCPEDTIILKKSIIARMIGK